MIIGKTGKRTGIDFSGYSVVKTEQEGLLVHELKRDGYNNMYSMKFINTNGIMAVTGDYGNWLFCREFHPSSGGFVSEHYWHEKLSLYSSQEGTEFDSESTMLHIEKGIESELEEYGYSEDNLETVKEYYEELLGYVDCGEWEYRAYAYSNVPGFMCSEDVPYLKKTKDWLNVVFDGFDELCRREINK